MFNIFSFHQNLPRDPIAVADRLDILMATKAAGNAGIRNELVSVCD